VAKGSAECLLKIPIVQGEFEMAHLCRLVGSLEIGGKEVNQSLPAGSDVELTLELDRGGRLTARALVPATGQMFGQVAHLLVPDASPEVLEASVEAMRKRVAGLRTDAFRRGAADVVRKLGDVERGLGEVEHDVDAARGGDVDAGQKARRALIELDAEIEQTELDKQWPELEERAVSRMTWAGSWISRHGTDRERELFHEVTAAVDRARQGREPRELQRQLRLVTDLGTAAFYRHPDAWEWMFESAASEIGNATDLPRAETLVREGKKAMAKGDVPGLRSATEQLWKLLPSDAQSRRLGYDSGLR
jgi:molecular chaperone DnaK